MRAQYKIHLVDSDYRRRAAIAHELADAYIHIEPYDGPDDFVSHWPDEGIVLVFDHPGSIDKLISAMTERGEWMPCIGYDEQPSPRRVASTVMAGAVDYLAYPMTKADLTAAVMEADMRANQSSNNKLRQAAARSRIARLTRRETEVLTGVANGLSNRLIGQHLSISPRTVEIHRANMLNKLQACHTSEAIRVAIEAGLVGQTLALAA